MMTQTEEHWDESAIVPTRYWHALDDGCVQCDLCPRFCKLREGQRGLCFVRANRGGAVVLATYGRSSGFYVDPIEKNRSITYELGVTGAWMRRVVAVPVVSLCRVYLPRSLDTGARAASLADYP